MAQNVNSWTFSVCFRRVNDGDMREGGLDFSCSSESSFLQGKMEGEMLEISGLKGKAWLACFGKKELRRIRL
jgi:hypothetical protein